MSVFKRAEWHSGLVYEATCDKCRSFVRYTDYELDFRPWYADGFIYCPTCRKPLRHSEDLSILNKKIPEEIVHQPAPQHTASNAPAAFCNNCGKKFADEDRFCSFCGTKRGNT